MRTPIACVVLAISLSLLACGSEEKRGTVAIAFHLHEPGATLFIGNPADHTLVLEPGTYRIVAVNHDDRVTAFEQFTLSQPSQVRLATGYDLHDPQLARDIRQVARALLRIDHARLLSLEAASTGFTVPLFTDAHPTLADTVTRIERMNAALAAAAAETHAMEAALSRIDTFAEGREPPLSVSIRPALTFGVFDAIKDKLLGFFRFAGAAGERAAADIARVAEELSPDQREDAFLDVAPGLTGGARNFDELLQKLQSGELNSSAAQVRAQLWANAEFSSAAQNVCNCNNPALTTAHTEGAELVTKGAELNVQVIKTVLGDVFPGISDGFDYADKADEWAEYLRDVYQDPLGQLDAAARAAIAERLKERILGDMEGCCPLLDEEDLDAAAEFLAGEVVGYIPPLRPDEEAAPAQAPGAATTQPTATAPPTEGGDETPEAMATLPPTPTPTPPPAATPETATASPAVDMPTVTPTAATATPGTPTVTATATDTATPSHTPTPSSTPTEAATATPTPTATATPTPTTAAVTNFAGSWHSAGTCDNFAAPYRWQVTLTQNGAQVSGDILFHNCPGGGRAGYSVSGTATSAGTITLNGTKTLELGGLGGSTPSQVQFTISPGGAPSPNYAP